MIENSPPEPRSATPFDALASAPGDSAVPGTAAPAADAPTSTFAAASFENEVAQQQASAPPEVATGASMVASTSMLSTAEDPTDDTAREAPRALSPGALLQDDFEIKEVLARGMTNLYRADTGGYGPSQPWIVAERELQPEPPARAAAAAPVEVPVDSPEPPAPLAAAPMAAPASIEEPAEEAAIGDAPASIEEPAAVASQAVAAPEAQARAEPVGAAPEASSGPVAAPADEASASSSEPEAAASLSDIPLSELARSTGTGLTDSGEFEHAGESGGLGSESGVFDAPSEIQAPLEMSPALPASAPPSALTEGDELYLDPEPLQPVRLRPADSVHLDLVHPPPAPLPVAELEDEEEELEDVPSLLMAGEVWEQDGRQYCAWEWAETTSLQDFRDSTNDERYFQVLGRVAEAMAWQKERGRVLELNRDTLRFDGAGQVHFYGFSSPLQDESELLNQLRGVNEFLLKHTFANSGTMRLDDPFAGLPLAEETKAFAHRLGEAGFGSFEEARVALQVLGSESDLEMSVALITDVGRQRELNEDSGLIARCARKTMLSPLEWELLIVADGMGGHEGGEIASDLTVRVLHQQLLESRWDWKDNAAVRAGLLAAIMATNARVAALADEPKYKGSRSRPGSTLTFAVRAGRRVWVGNVGDSRTYIFRDNQLLRVTKDHSYVQNLIDAGALDEEDAWDHPDGSIITAHIGEANLKTRDIFMRLLLPGDKLLLVSDGVIDMLRDREIAPFLQQAQPGAICRSLVSAANAAGGADNITALCLCCY